MAGDRREVGGDGQMRRTTEVGRRRDGGKDTTEER